MLIDAIKRGASDIHFEPYETDYRVRLRIDGILKQVAKAPVKLNTRIAARLKVMAQLDIAEKRVPQDGRIKLNLSQDQADRLPRQHPADPVRREDRAAYPGRQRGQAGHRQAGLRGRPAATCSSTRSQKPYGMVLVTGPTGSGKTVSLYTALNILNDDARNISTVEDPVEIRVPGINQVQMNIKRGMTFAAALRSFLRQDPDVIMVGEIRDLETAEIGDQGRADRPHGAVHPAHQRRAADHRPPDEHGHRARTTSLSSVTLVIAQRLARRLCNNCKRPMELPAHALLAEGFTQAEIDAGFTVYEAVGCDECTEGYKGRTGIYQVMPMSDEIAAIVLEGGNAMQIAEAAQKAGRPRPAPVGADEGPRTASPAWPRSTASPRTEPMDAVADAPSAAIRNTATPGALHGAMRFAGIADSGGSLRLLRGAPMFPNPAGRHRWQIPLPAITGYHAGIIARRGDAGYRG